MRWLLGRLAKFCDDRRDWPSAPELLAYVAERGSVRTLQRDLATLRYAGLVVNTARRWVVTEEGFAFAALPVARAWGSGGPRRCCGGSGRAAKKRARKLRQLSTFRLLEALEVVD
jgi:hypothetical protein